MRTQLLLLTVLLMSFGPVFAHHQFASEFDANKTVTLNGKVVRMDWINPHSWLHVDVLDAGGTVVTWAVEFGSPGGLMKRGWRKADLPVGVMVTVDGFLAKNGTPTANANKVTLPDGKILFAGSSFGQSQ